MARVFRAGSLSSEFSRAAGLGVVVSPETAKMTVRVLQSTLNVFGFPLKVDGVPGSKTRGALRNLLEEKGLPSHLGGVTFIPSLQKLGGWIGDNATRIAESLRVLTGGRIGAPVREPPPIEPVPEDDELPAVALEVEKPLYKRIIESKWFWPSLLGAGILLVGGYVLAEKRTGRGG